MLPVLSFIIFQFPEELENKEKKNFERCQRFSPPSTLYYSTTSDNQNIDACFSSFFAILEMAFMRVLQSEDKKLRLSINTFLCYFQSVIYMFINLQPKQLRLFFTVTTMIWHFGKLVLSCRNKYKSWKFAKKALKRCQCVKRIY